MRPADDERSFSFQGGYPRWEALYLTLLVSLVTVVVRAAFVSAGLAIVAAVPLLLGAVIARRCLWTLMHARVEIQAGWATLHHVSSTNRVRLDGAAVFVTPYGIGACRYPRHLGRAGFVDEEGRVLLCSGVGARHWLVGRAHAGRRMVDAALAAGAQEIDAPLWIPFVGWRIPANGRAFDA